MACVVVHFRSHVSAPLEYTVASEPDRIAADVVEVGMALVDLETGSRGGVEHGRGGRADAAAYGPGWLLLPPWMTPPVL